MASDGSGVGDLFDVLCEALFWFLLAAIGFTCFWQLLANCSSERSEEESEEKQSEQPDEWEKLPEEEKSLLKRFFKFD
jgi:hypothetical protein